MMNTIAIERTNKLQKYFETFKHLTIWLFVVSIVLKVIGLFHSVNLAAVFCLGLFSFLAIVKGRKQEISDVFTSVLIVADCSYIVAIMFMLGRLFMVM